MDKIEEKLTIATIVEKWLKENGYDGLYLDLGEDESCGCALDNFMPCEEPGECVAGHRNRGLMYPGKGTTNG
jgi:hypothetical protein